MAVEDQYRLLRNAGYDPSEAADLLGADVDQLEPKSSTSTPTSSPNSPSTWTPYERYVSYYPDMYRREVGEFGGLSPWTCDAIVAADAEVSPYDPDLDASGYYHQVVEEYLDELEAEYAEQLAYTKQLQQRPDHQQLGASNA